MKRSFLFVAILLASMISAFAENVSVQTAQTAAQSFLNAKMGNTQQISLVEFVERAGFPNLYVFGNERCFVIIAGDDAVHPVLGYSTENGFCEETMPDEVRSWLQTYDSEIAFIKNNRLEALPEAREGWGNLLSGKELEPKSRSFVKPLIHTWWNQKAPFNNLCPADEAGPGGHAVAGCGAIAMAQIMNYWEHPVRGVGSHSYSHSVYGEQYVNFAATTYDWDNIKGTYSTGYTDEEALAVATLVYHCGVSIDMEYGPNSSNARYPILDDAMRDYFDYSPNTEYVFKSQYTDDQWIAMLKSDLNNLQPVLYRAASNNQGANAHLFICDGYDENNYFHFNWGHGGNYDGYYTISYLHEGSTNYTYGNAAMFGCKPNTPPINPPTNVNASVAGRTVTVSWNSVSNASYYKLYRDDNLVNGHVNGTSLSDYNAPFGLHSYYVKSVKTDGTTSLISNSAEANVVFPGPQPTNLQTEVNNHNVSLSWQTETAQTAVFQYGDGIFRNSFDADTIHGNRTLWAQRFPVSMLQDYAGMAIEKVAFYVHYAGDYTVCICKGNETGVDEVVYQQNYIATAENSWQDIVFNTPVFVDYTHDLWVVFYSNVFKPASYLLYNGPNLYDALLISSTQSGTWYWQRRVGNWSWMIRTYLTDGTYSYNLYRDNNPVATNLTGNTYTDTNLPDGFYDYHVTTNYFGGESDPSNTAHVQVGNPTYTISTSSSPSNGGTTSGGGTFNYNQSCTVTATPASGYTFVNWTENGTQVSTNANYTFNVIGNRNLVANFSQITYTVTTSSSPSNGGTTSGGGTFTHGQSCTVTATLASGYHFENWTENGTQVSTNASYTFNVTSSRNLVANFSQNTYTITTSSNPANGGTTSGGGTFNHGQSCTVTATPASGYNFENWTENGTQVSTNANYTFNVTSNRSLVANFSQDTYTVTTSSNPTNGGTTSGGGTYIEGQSCTVHAIPASGYHFENWTENGTTVSEDANFQFNVTGDRNLVANFSQDTHTVTTSSNPTNGGTTSGGGTFTHGQSCTVYATANSGYTFVNWTENGNETSRDSSYTFNVTSDRNLVANFSLLQYVVSADIEPADGGIVLGTGTYNCGETVSLEAVANENHSFVGWWENGSPVSSNPTMVIIVDDNRHFTASFALVSGIGEGECNVAVYPNPANNVLFIEGDGIRKVTVFNALGQVLESGEYANQERVTLNTGNYEAGIYMLQIRIQNNTVRKQFIKQ